MAGLLAESSLVRGRHFLLCVLCIAILQLTADQLSSSSLHFIGKTKIPILTKRYHRLCSVIEGSRRELYFNIAKYGSIAAAAIAFITNVINGFILRMILFRAILTLCFLWLLSVDFYANYSLVNRALVIVSAPMGREGESARFNHQDQIKHRINLKKRLIIYFGLGLGSNVSTVISLSLGGFLYKQVFLESVVLSGCLATAYIILNLYFLDVLRDGVLNPPKLNPRRELAVVEEIELL
jgi:hypothetical protein